MSPDSHSRRLADFLWHFLQGWWYRTLVDAKVLEIKWESGGDREQMLALLRGKYGMKI